MEKTIWRNAQYKQKHNHTGKACSGLVPYPRVILSAPHRSSGKTTLSIGLSAALSQQGITVQTFKKGPDFIDPMWLSYAANRDCYNLDLYMMSEDNILRIFKEVAINAQISIIEGNKGLYDGMEIDMDRSTAYLAKILKSPVILVIDVSHINQGVVPLILGYKQFAPDVFISGVILNKIANTRHESKLISAINYYCGIKIFGSIPESVNIKIPQRHLGLVPVKERADLIHIIDNISDMIRRYVNLDNIIEVSNSAVGLKPIPMLNNKIGKPNKVGSTIKLGIAKDAAFTFYYPDNLFALQEAGAELIPFSPLDDTTLPDVDGLYIGGGFPEVFMHKLSQNHAMREAIYSAINRGMPVYAECGGLIYLSRSITWNNLTLSMVGALPCDIEILSKPQGHGYVTLKCTEDNPWEAPDTQIKGHEFHYSRIINLDNGKVNFAYNVIRGKGIDGRYDGIIYKNVLASYTHIHGTAVPQWATGIVRLCQQLQS